jgi:hypothetical protein
VISLNNLPIFVITRFIMRTKKISIAFLLILVINIAGAAFHFTGMNGEKDRGSKYSLKNLNSFHHSLSIYSVKSGLKYYSSDVFKQCQLHNSNVAQLSSMIRYDKGNTTFIMPFKYKIKVPKFKTPTAPNY